MSTTVHPPNPFCAFLEEHDDGAWKATLHTLLPRIHPVDRDATRIWFGFWPLRLSVLLAEGQDQELTAAQRELQGRYHLQDQLAESIRFLFGARFWSPIAAALLSRARGHTEPENGDLTAHILETAGEVADLHGVDDSNLIGITAVSFMIIRQIGLTAFESADHSGLSVSGKMSADSVMRTRTKKRLGLLGFLRTINRRHKVVFDHRKDQRGAFFTIQGQDISSAAGADRRDYRDRDPRCSEGPIPFQCRSGACGTCWVGILSGKEKVSEITPFEKKRLKLFGYDFANGSEETHPPLRLSCQAKCYGDLSVVVSPWNGVLGTSGAAQDP